MPEVTEARTTEKAPRTLGSGVIAVLFVSAAIVSAILFFLIPTWSQVVYDPEPTAEAKGSGADIGDGVEATSTASTSILFSATHYVPTPTAVRAIYMSQCVVGTPSFRNDLVELIDDTELNAVIIDIKDYTGKIAFTTDHPDLAASV